VIAAGRKILFLLSASIVACATGTVDIGVVDIEQAYQRSPLVMASAARLNAEFAGTRQNLKKRGRELAELRHQLEFGGTSLAADDHAELDARLAAKTVKLAELQNQYRTDLNAAQKREGEQMIETVTAVAIEVAEQEGLTLLLDEEAVLYSHTDRNPPRDITELVIRALLDRINPTQIPTNTRTNASDP
jgi:Skp family chaperone for outer membrane proteins